ncbi:hypothetical protein FRX31_024477 [Thalictrum thalictroides]|uniref:Xylanase inhibitor N-terminal domain-containing protein n=1 Tax=Thalictrum thalictroides TaxID=46969 RepID=A0A7J6VNK7_THATH|nr:hypothetical protein FRX31_024477 [Thalictrum thalictroides]
MIGTRRCEENGKCQYSYHYIDGSYTMGNLAQETLINDNDGTNITQPNVIIGCGHKNTYHPRPREGIPGIIGLNTGLRVLHQYLHNYLTNTFLIA